MDTWTVWTERVHPWREAEGSIAKMCLCSRADVDEGHGELHYASYFESADMSHASGYTGEVTPGDPLAIVAGTVVETATDSLVATNDNGSYIYSRRKGKSSSNPAPEETPTTVGLKRTNRTKGGRWRWCWSTSTKGPKLPNRRVDRSSTGDMLCTEVQGESAI